MKKRNLKTVATVIEKRTEKRKEQLQHLKAKRQSQWEDELLKAAVSALPRSTPKVIEERMLEIKRHHPADAPASEAALDAIDLLKENLNGAPSSVMSTDPFKLLLAETMMACSRQTSKWKLLPMVQLHPFAPRITVMTAITGKRISRNDMMQMEMVAKDLKNSLESVYDNVVDNNGAVATEKELLEKLRDLYPSVLVTKDDTAINSILDASTATRAAAEVPDWACGPGYVDSDGEPDGYILDLEDINTDVTEDNDNDDDDDDDDADEEGVEGANNGDIRDDEAVIENSAENLEALSLADDDDKAIQNGLPKPVATPPMDPDFTSSLSDSLVESVLQANKKDYHAMPPPSRHLGLYSMVPPLESSPKQSTPMPSPPSPIPLDVKSRPEPKREASPLHGQPTKLLRVEPKEAEIRQLRQQLEESNRKVATLGQCITDMQVSIQQERWDRHRRGMSTRSPVSTRDRRPARVSRQQRLQLPQQPRRSRQPPVPDTPRPSRRRTTTTSSRPESPVQLPRGPRTSAAERTRQLIGREALGGQVPGPVIHDTHRITSRRSYDR